MKAYIKETHPREKTQHVEGFFQAEFSQPHFLQPIIEEVRLDKDQKSEAKEGRVSKVVVADVYLPNLKSLPHLGIVLYQF